MPQSISEKLRCLVNPSQRKLILFACSCVREIWHLLKDETKNAVIAAERYADAAALAAVVSDVDTAVNAAASYATFASESNEQAKAKHHQLFDDIFGS